MSNAIRVQENTHKIWKTGAVFSVIMSVVFFLIYWNMEDPLWTGIFRLGAFVFFAVSILGGLKLLGSSLAVTIDVNDEFLLVTYLKKGEVIQEEQFNRDTIKKIYAVKPANNVFYRYLQPASRFFKVSFTDTSKKLYFLEFGGRPLLFDPNSRQTIENFLQDFEID